MTTNRGLRITVDPRNPSDALAAVSQADRARYEEDYIPVENQLIESLDDTSIIDDARERTEDLSGLFRTAGRNSREARRYGFRLNKAQRQQAGTAAFIDRRANDADILNESRLTQFDRNRGLRNNLIDIGRGLDSRATQGLSDAAGLQTGRENANRRAEAAADAQNDQLLFSLGSTALMAALVL